jgi:hypothetical protein
MFCKLPISEITKAKQFSKEVLYPTNRPTECERFDRQLNADYVNRKADLRIQHRPVDDLMPILKKVDEAVRAAKMTTLYLTPQLSRFAALLYPALRLWHFSVSCR